MPSGRENIDSLTGLRGFAALWVVLFHTCFGASNGYLPGFSEKLDWGILRNVIVQGVYAVDIFFVLSGYILTYVHRKEFEQTFKIADIRTFLALRLARIYPMHVFIALLLGVAYVLGFWNEKAIEFEDVWLSAFLLNMWIDPSINTPAWSVSAEWMAYLGFPACIQILTRVTRPFRQFMGIALLSTIYPSCVMAYDWGWEWHFGWVALFRVLNGFFLGCLLYYFQENCPRLKETFRSSVWCFGALFLLGSFLLLGASIMFIYPLLPWVIVTLAFAQGGIGRIFSNKIAVVLGTVSFSIYMIHYPVLEVFRLGFNDYYASLNPEFHQSILWIHLLGIGFAIIGFSWLCYWGIEKRWRDYYKRRLRIQPLTYNQVAG